MLDGARGSPLRRVRAVHRGLLRRMRAVDGRFLRSRGADVRARRIVRIGVGAAGWRMVRAAAVSSVKRESPDLVVPVSAGADVAGLGVVCGRGVRHWRHICGFGDVCCRRRSYIGRRAVVCRLFIRHASREGYAERRERKDEFAVHVTPAFLFARG